eukprot:385470_1
MRYTFNPKNPHTIRLSAMGANVDTGNPPPKVPLPHSRAYQSFYESGMQKDETKAQQTILQTCYGRALSSACKSAGTQEPPASTPGNEPAVTARLMKIYLKLLAKDLKGIGSHPDFDPERYPETAAKIVRVQ